MPDYNIYIRDLTGGSGSASPTSPAKSEEEPSGAEIFLKGASAVKSFASSGASNFINSGVASVSKVIPAIAIAVAALKTTDKILTTGFSHLEDYTGNYQYAMAYNNIKTGLGNFINPVGYLLNEAHRQAQFDKQNKRIQQERTLIGNSQLTTYKVGV